MDIQEDSPIEVTKEQYLQIMNGRYTCGSCAGLEENGKYFIKVWFMDYVPQIKQILGVK